MDGGSLGLLGQDVLVKERREIEEMGLEKKGLNKEIVGIGEAVVHSTTGTVRRGRRRSIRWLSGHRNMARSAILGML